MPPDSLLSFIQQRTPRWYGAAASLTSFAPSDTMYPSEEAAAAVVAVAVATAAVAAIVAAEESVTSGSWVVRAVDRWAKGHTVTVYS